MIYQREMPAFKKTIVTSRLLEETRNSLINTLLNDRDEFRYIEEKSARIKDLGEKRLTNSLQLECQKFHSLLTLTWIDIVMDSGLLNRTFVEQFEQNVTKQSSSKLSPLHKIMLFQIYTNLNSKQHPQGNLLTKVWPQNLEKTLWISSNFIECSKIDLLINGETRKGAFEATILPGFFIPNIYYSKSHPGVCHPIFLQRKNLITGQASLQAISYINTLLVHRHLKNADGLMFEYTDLDDSCASSIAKEIQKTFD